MMRYLPGWMLGVLWWGAIAAEATPPTAPARLIADSHQAFAQEEEVRDWLHAHAEEVARGLTAAGSDEVVLLTQYTVIEWRQPHLESSWVFGAGALFVIQVPAVPRGTAWREQKGRVLVGYLRPYEQQQGDVRITETYEAARRVEHRKETAHHVLGMKRLDVEATPQPGDAPIFADTVRLLVDSHGKLYY